MYFRFALCFRDAEEILAARGVIITYEGVRQFWYRVLPELVSSEFRVSNLQSEAGYLALISHQDYGNRRRILIHKHRSGAKSVAIATV